jgi:glucan-binding YG repeat protein
MTEQTYDESAMKSQLGEWRFSWVPGTTFTVYARVAADDTKAASEWVASDTLTLPGATTAPTISTAASEDNTITITANAATDYIYFTVDGSDPVFGLGSGASETTVDATGSTISGTQYCTGGTVTITIPTKEEITVKAMAVAMGAGALQVHSDVVSQTFNKVESNNEEEKKDDGSKDDGSKDDGSKNEGSTDGNTAKAEIEEAADGTKTIVDESGNVIADSKVTVDGKSYITDESGKVITSDKVTTEDGKTYITDADGVIETGKVSFEGNQYITGSDGAILTDKVTKTPSGNKVYVDEDGVIVKNQAVSSNGKKYYATKSGKIATNGFVKTAKGNTVYATKSGVLKVNKAFKASNGKKYVADKNGKIVKGKKITIGNKIYTTNKKGVIIKVTTKKK